MHALAYLIHRDNFDESNPVHVPGRARRHDKKNPDFAYLLNLHMDGLGHGASVPRRILRYSLVLIGKCKSPMLPGGLR